MHESLCFDQETGSGLSALIAATNSRLQCHNPDKFPDGSVPTPSNSTMERDGTLAGWSQPNHLPNRHQTQIPYSASPWKTFNLQRHADPSASDAHYDISRTMTVLKGGKTCYVRLHFAYKELQKALWILYKLTRSFAGESTRTQNLFCGWLSGGPVSRLIVSCKFQLFSVVAF